MVITSLFDIPYIKERQQRVMRDAIFNTSEILSGFYPMGKIVFKEEIDFLHENCLAFSARLRLVAHAVKPSFISHRNMNVELFIPTHGGHDPDRAFIFSA